MSDIANDLRCGLAIDGLNRICNFMDLGTQNMHV